MEASQNPESRCWNVRFENYMWVHCIYLIQYCFDYALYMSQEESGLVVNRFDLHHKGILLTSRPDPGTQQEKSLLRIHIYACTSWTGTPETWVIWYGILILGGHSWYIHLKDGGNGTRMDRHRGSAFEKNGTSFIVCWAASNHIPWQWPEARIYVPPLLQSILQDKLNTEMLLARVDYEYLTSVQAPTPSPPLLGLSISFENGDGDDLPMERLSGWWMTFTTARVLSLVAENSGI